MFVIQYNVFITNFKFKLKFKVSKRIQFNKYNYVIIFK